MNPKLLKERMRTKAQRPDVIVAFDNLARAGNPRKPAPPAPEKDPKQKKSA